ncbi:MAG: TonB-dependent receptor [Pseudomonadota bacterium]
MPKTSFFKGGISPMLAAVAVFAAPPLLAQEPPPSSTSDTPVVLQGVTVQASPFKGDPDALVQPVIVLKGADLERKRKATIGELLEGELGVSTSDFGPGVGRPVIRGQGGTRVLVLSNGIAALDVSSVSDDHAVSVDPGFAEQVEIIKGPATLIYGSAASAGVVNVVDHRLAEKVTPGFASAAELSYGDNGRDFSGKAELEYGLGQNQFHADFGGRSTRAFDIPGNSASDGSGEQGRIPNSQGTTGNGALSYSRVGERGSVSAALSTFNAQYGLVVEPTAFIDLKQTRLDLQGVLLAPAAGFKSLRARLGANVYTHTEFEDVGVPGTKFYNTEQELRVEAEHKPLGRWHGVVGLQAGQRRFEARGEEALSPKTDSVQIGLFAVEKTPFHFIVPGQFELGARAETVSHQPFEGKIDPRLGVPSQDSDFVPLSVSAGSLFELDDSHHLRFSLSRSERAPTPEELYAYGPHGATGVFERGNQNLKQEAASNFEISLDRHKGRWTWLGNVYYEEIRNFVYLAEAPADGRNADGSASGQAPADGQTIALVDGEGSFVRADAGADEAFTLADYRQAKARFYGAEAETRYKLLTGPVKLSARLFGDLVRGSLQRGGDLPRITPPRYGLGLEGSQGPLAGALTLTQVAEQNHFALDGPTAGYTLLSADASFKLPTTATDASVFLRGRNLLDEEARRATSFLKNVYPLPGRSFFVGVNFRL